MLMDDSLECHFQNPIDPILNDAFQIFLKTVILKIIRNHLSQSEVDNIIYSFKIPMIYFLVHLNNSLTRNSNRKLYRK